MQRSVGSEWINLLLIIFTRYPRAGHVKTRLIPALGERGAMLIHRKMVEYTMAQACHFKGSIEVCYTGGSLKEMKKWLGYQLLYREQKGASLGEKLSKAVIEAFTEGFKKTVIIGTDCPSLTIEHINKAFLLLDSSELVLGPAVDGGYYLIGLSSYHQELFQNISWGSDKVYRQTLRAAEKLTLKTAIMEKLADLDRPADLPDCLTTMETYLER